MSIDNKKVIVCDLDGTLTESKLILSKEMADVLCGVLRRHFLVVISGGAFSQFQKQFLSHFSCSSELMQNLLLFPTSGSTCYKYNNGEWKQIYNEALTSKEREKIKKAFEEAIIESRLDLTPIYGEIIEDRNSQITFSGHGQEAPIEIKENWDKDQSKRKQITEILKRKIPEFEIRIGGMTSIDVTRQGIDKAYAIQKIESLLNVSDDDIVFVGDALYKGGNDASTKKTGVDYIQEDGPRETIELLRQFM